MSRVDVGLKIAFVEKDALAEFTNVLHRLLRQHFSLVLRDVMSPESALRRQMLTAKLANPIFFRGRRLFLLLLSLLASATVLLVVLKTRFRLKDSLAVLTFLVIRFACLRKMMILHHVLSNELTLTVLAHPHFLLYVNRSIVVDEIVATLKHSATNSAIKLTRSFDYQVRSLHVHHKNLLSLHN